MKIISTKRLGLLVVILLWSTASFAQGEVADSMTRSMDPSVYMRMMTNPAMMSNPVASCAECHNGEDVARYNTAFGPMLQMMNSQNWFNPNAYSQMMVPMMNPATYTQWYNAWMKRYGGAMNPAPGGGATN